MRASSVLANGGLPRHTDDGPARVAHLSVGGLCGRLATDGAPTEGTTLADLAHRPVWVAWREETRKGKGAAEPKPTKVPYAPGGGLAEANNPGTWGTRAQAGAKALELLRGGRTGGIGLMLGEVPDDAGLAVFGLDLDTCRDAVTGDLEPWAAEMLARFPTYAEVSPSRTGVKLFGLYRVEDRPALLDALREAAGGAKRYGFNCKFGAGEHPPGIEFYTSHRFFAVTGKRMPDAPADVRLFEAGPLLELIREHATAPREANGGGGRVRDESRSAQAMRLGCRLVRRGAGFGEMRDALLEHPDTAEWAETKGLANGERELERIFEKAGGAPREPSRLRFLSPGECEAAPRGDYVLKGLLSPGDIAAIIGEPGAGKSLLAPHLGYMVALGVPAFGMRSRKGGVLYVAAEDPRGMEGRVAALRLEHGDAPGFELVAGVSDLLTEGSPDLAALLAAVEEREPALVFLDTVQMAFPGLEENEAAPMGRVVRVARLLAQRGAAVVLVHHPAKGGDTPRGHSGLNGALDVSLFLTGQDTAGVVRGRLKKNRNGTCDRDVAFRVAVRELGTDADGDPITAALVDELEPGDAPKAEKLPRAEAAALDVLKELAERQGRAQPGGRVTVHEADWRHECDRTRRVSTAEEKDSRTKAFRRAYRGLGDKGLVLADDGLVWLPGFADPTACFDDPEEL